MLSEATHGRRLLSFLGGGLIFCTFWGGCGGGDSEPGNSTCLVATDCPPGQVCSAGVCQVSPADNGPRIVPGIDAGGPSPDDDAGGDDVCPALVTCEGVGAECGSIEDGCDGYISCGDCEAPDVCGGGGSPNTCGASCAPSRSCADADVECGELDDGCGNPLDCGDSCLDGETCGGGGEPNRCGSTCTALTCEELGATCGIQLDGCNGSLDCGSCPPGQVCSGGTCRSSCTPLTCGDYDAECGPAADGCGTLLDCGSCRAPETCGGGGQQYQCGCRAKTCADFTLLCGDFDDGCGKTINCGCSSQFACESGRCERVRWVLQAEDPRARHYTGVEHTGGGRTFWRANVPEHDRGMMTSGPNTAVPVGSYRVRFRLYIVSKIGDSDEGVAVIEVNDSHDGMQTNLVKRTLRRRDFSAEKEWVTFNLDVDWPVSAGHTMVPRVHFLDKPYASIYHDYTVIDQR